MNSFFVRWTWIKWIKRKWEPLIEFGKCSGNVHWWLLLCVVIGQTSQWRVNCIARSVHYTTKSEIAIDRYSLGRWSLLVLHWYSSSRLFVYVEPKWLTQWCQIDRLTIFCSYCGARLSWPGSRGQQRVITIGGRFRRWVTQVAHGRLCYVCRSSRIDKTCVYLDIIYGTWINDARLSVGHIIM